MRPRVSIVVPTRDRPASLAACLRALSVQTIAGALELIVVDDGSVAEAEVASVVTGRAPTARLVRSTGRGPAAARNLGASLAHGAVLCFTDDDCVPCADWAERLAEGVENGADAVAGTTLSSGGALADASEVVARAPARVQATGGGLAFAPSNNLGCAAEVWESVPFDESYPYAAAEDRDWCARIAAAGYALRSVPAARLVHQQDLTIRSFFAKQVQYGYGAYRFRGGAGGGVELEPAGFYLGLVRDAFAEGVAVGLLVAAAQLATAVGFVRGAAAARLRPHR